MLVDAGYTVEEAKWLRNPANPTRSPVHGQNQMAFRGKDRANVYVNPTSTPDPGLVGVSGNIAEGIDLDGNAKTGFTSPTGEKGIDNNFYKTLGCWKTYRGPQRLSSGALQFNDSMRNGGWTTVIVVAGKGTDPMNDENVTVGFYVSDDKMVKDGNGNIARDYTFRIKPHAKYEAMFPARTENGVIISTKPADVMLRDPSYTQDLELLRAQVNLEMKPDGSFKGYVGGYRPWEPVYKGWVNARGPVIEVAHLGAVAGRLLRSAAQCRLQPDRKQRREDAHLLCVASRCDAGVRHDARMRASKSPRWNRTRHRQPRMNHDDRLSASISSTASLSIARPKFRPGPTPLFSLRREVPRAALNSLGEDRGCRVPEVERDLTALTSRVDEYLPDSGCARSR